MGYEWHNKCLEIGGDGSVIKALNERRIVSIELLLDGVKFVEGCDDYFGAMLTPLQLDKFISELVEMRAKL